MLVILQHYMVYLQHLVMLLYHCSGNN